MASCGSVTEYSWTSSLKAGVTSSSSLVPSALERSTLMPETLRFSAR